MTCQATQRLPSFLYPTTDVCLPSACLQNHATKCIWVWYLWWTYKTTRVVWHQICNTTSVNNNIPNNTLSKCDDTCQTQITQFLFRYTTGSVRLTSVIRYAEHNHSAVTFTLTLVHHASSVTSAIHVSKSYNSMGLPVNSILCCAMTSACNPSRPWYTVTLTYRTPPTHG